MAIRDLIIFIALAFCWAMSFIFYRLGVPEFGSLVFASLRVIFAALTMVFFVVHHKSYLAEIKKHWKLLGLIGLMSSVIPFSMFAYASESVNAGVLSVVNASAPMSGGIIASVFFNDKLSKKQIVGMMIGVIGVGVLMSQHIFDSTQQHSDVLPMSIALFACVGYATGANITRHYLYDVSPIAITAGSLIIAGIVMLPLALYHFPYEQEISLMSWFSVVSIGVISTALAYVFMNQLIKSIGPVRVMCITLVIPIFAIVMGYVLLDENMDITAIIGSVIILTGTYLSLNLSIKRLLQKNTESTKTDS